MTYTVLCATTLGTKPYIAEVGKMLFLKIKPGTRPLPSHGIKKGCGKRSKENNGKKSVSLLYKPIIKKNNGAMRTGALDT